MASEQLHLGLDTHHQTALAKGEVGIAERRRIPGFKESLIGFLKWSEFEHQSHPATHRRYQVSAVALRTYFGHVRLDTVTPEDVEQFKTTRSAQGARAQSAN